MKRTSVGICLHERRKKTDKNRFDSERGFLNNKRGGECMDIITTTAFFFFLSNHLLPSSRLLHFIRYICTPPSSFFFFFILFFSVLPTISTEREVDSKHELKKGEEVQRDARLKAPWKYPPLQDSLPFCPLLLLSG